MYFIRSLLVTTCWGRYFPTPATNELGMCNRFGEDRKDYAFTNPCRA